MSKTTPTTRRTTLTTEPVTEVVSVYACMYSSAENYDANATIDDGSCYVTTTTTMIKENLSEKAEELNDDSGTGKVLTLGAIGAGVFALIRKRRRNKKKNYCVNNNSFFSLNIVQYYLGDFMKKNLNKQSLLNIVLILYTLSIVLDLHVFYNNISTLIRVVLISVIFLVIIIKYSSKKERKLFYIYFCALIVYSGFHLYFNINFTSRISTSYNILNEILYFYKMIMNIFIIYIVYKLSINFESFSKYMKISLWFMCGSIVICNIFKLGYTSYDFYSLKCNIFDWFGSNSCDFDTISGKGYFHLTNQIVAIVLLYLPLLLNELKEHLNIQNICLLLVSLLSMLMMGNRLSSAGPLIILVIGLLTTILLSTLKKEKANYLYILTLIGTIIVYNVLLYNAPILKREDYYDKLTGPSTSVKNNNELEPNSKVTLEEFEDKKLNMNFIEKYYPYDKDPDFWNGLINFEPEVLSDSRYIEKLIIKRVKEVNNNNLDNAFGIGYTRVMNIFNIEKDYVVQYYSIGVIGILLFLSIYFIILIKCIIKVLSNFEDKLNFKNILLILAMGIALVGAYFSGNILNAISTIIPISFVLGIMLNEINEKKAKPSKLLGFNVYDGTSKELIDGIFDDMDNKKQNIIYNINPLIITNFYKSKKIVKEFNDQKYQIPDGYGVVIASKMKDMNISKTINGVELVEAICKEASHKNKKIFLYGSREGIARRAKLVLEKKYKKINIIGTLNGYMDQKEAIKEIVKAKPDILFIALGSPKQEEFIINNKNLFSDINVIMPVGGSLDVISENIKRAPKIYHKLHLEWLYRMIKEPKRIRQNANLIKYICLVIFRNNWYNNFK